MTILYHPGKANIVADALSRKAVSMESLAMLQVDERYLARDVQSLANSFVRLDISKSCKVFMNHCSLKYIFNQRDLNLRQRRWLELHKD